MQRPTLSGRSPPKERREAFGGVNLKSTNELVYQVGKNNNDFLKRTVKLRGDTVNGLSFIHSVAKSIPIDQSSTIIAGKRKGTDNNVDHIIQQLQTPIVNDNDSKNKDKSNTYKNNTYRQLKVPEHGKKEIFLKDTFSNSNCASSQVSENGKTLAATYYSNERPWGGMPALYKGESKFASTSYTGHGKKPEVQS